MSQVSHPTISLPTQLRSHRAVTLAWLLALAATAAIVLTIALDGDSPEYQPRVGAIESQPAPVADVGRESAVAAAVGTRATPFPDESRIAASVGSRSVNSSPPFSYGLDESRQGVAAGGGSSTSSSGPDESGTAASISGR